MRDYTFKETVCALLELEEEAYHREVLRACLSNRARLLRPLISLVSPNFLFNENRLIEKVGQSTSLKEVREEVDFYQHKFVSNFFLKDTLRFRISGIRLISLAQRAFDRANRQSLRSS
jgi:hypothetical protein